ncbi:MAG TPA: DEAD/DEAH box helicase, partial [Cyclobacteriaceae bacterium]|nr:DEAD/DEAH box helicase [Cyclobacteriaceae bacterium]
FQKKIVSEALEKGRFGVFADCGLGKTFIQLEWGQQVANHSGKPVLLTCPLAVGGQTIKEAHKFGYGSNISKIGTDSAIQMVNYENLDKVDFNKYAGVILDESSILKNYEGAYRNLIIEGFQRTPYKLACTATPAPNDPMELGNHSEFLGTMSRQEMLSMYYVHDGGETAKWRLKGHAIDKYYHWVRGWAIMLTKPSDLGFDDAGYDLPKLNYIEEQIKTETKGLSLFNDVAVSATEFNGELRRTKEARMKKVADIVNASDENFVIWIKQNEEGEMLRKLIPGSIEVSGSDSNEYKEEMLLGFADNKFRVLITKTSIASFGLNYQNCHNTIFASLDFSFEKLYQAIRRFYRFGQQHQVNVYLITTDTMRNVTQSLSRKQKDFETMQLLMSKAIH